MGRDQQGTDVIEERSERDDLLEEVRRLRGEVAELRGLAEEVEELRRTVAAAAALLIGVSRVSPDAVEAASPDR